MDQARRDCGRRAGRACRGRADGFRGHIRRQSIQIARHRLDARRAPTHARDRRTGGPVGLSTPGGEGVEGAPVGARAQRRVRRGRRGCVGLAMAAACCAGSSWSTASVRAACAPGSRATRRACATSTTCSGAPAATADRKGSGERSPVRFEVGEVHVDDAKLMLRDEVAGVAGTATLDSFTSGRLVSGRETPVEFRTTVTLEKPQALRLTFDGASALTFDADSGRASLRATTVKIGGDTQSLKSLHATLAGTLAWDGSTLTAAPIDLRVSDAKMAGIALGPSSLTAQRLVYSPTSQRLELERPRAGRDGHARREPVRAGARLAAARGRRPHSCRAAASRAASSSKARRRWRAASNRARRAATSTPCACPASRSSSTAATGRASVEGQAQVEPAVAPGAQCDRASSASSCSANLVESGRRRLALGLSGNAGVDARGAQWALQGALSNNRFDSNGSAGLRRRRADGAGQRALRPRST